MPALWDGVILPGPVVRPVADMRTGLSYVATKSGAIAAQRRVRFEAREAGADMFMIRKGWHGRRTARIRERSTVQHMARWWVTL